MLDNLPSVMIGKQFTDLVVVMLKLLLKNMKNFLEKEKWLISTQPTDLTIS